MTAASLPQDITREPKISCIHPIHMAAKASPLPTSQDKLPRPLRQMGGPKQDPVCGMAVSAQSPHRVEYEGRSIFFCSEGCRAKFVSNPGQYLQAEAAGGDHVVTKGHGDHAEHGKHVRRAGHESEFSLCRQQRVATTGKRAAISLPRPFAQDVRSKISSSAT